MYQSHLYAIKTAIWIFPIIAFIFLIPYMVYQYSKYGSISFFRSALVYSFIFYLLSTVFLVMLPLLPRSVVAEMVGPTSDMRFFGFISDLRELGLLQIGSAEDLFRLISHDRFMEPLLNVALLIPLGVYLRYYFKRTWFETLVIGLCLSFTIELTQLSGLFGFYARPHRLFQVDDLMLNTVGAVLGYLLTPVFVFMFPSRDMIDARALSRKNDITFTRRALAFFLDWALILGVSAVVVKILGGSLHFDTLIQNPRIYFKAFIMNSTIYGASIGIIFFYFVLLPFIFNGQTAGKFMVKIRLENSEGERVSFFRLLLRTGIFYSYINIYYWSLIRFFEYRMSTVEFGSFARILPITLLVLMLLVLLDYVYTRNRKIPLLYERLSGVHVVSSHF